MTDRAAKDGCMTDRAAKDGCMTDRAAKDGCILTRATKRLQGRTNNQPPRRRHNN